jgi:hypothetical protein
MTEDVVIRIDRTTLQSVYTCTQLGMEPSSDQPTEPTLPCELSVVTDPSCIRPSKRIPPQKEMHRNCEMPPCGHMGDALRGWSHLHLPPLIPSILLAGMVPHLPSSTRPYPHSRRGGVYESPIDKLIHSLSDRGKLMSSIRK